MNWKNKIEVNYAECPNCIQKISYLKCTENVIYTYKFRPYKKFFVYEKDLDIVYTNNLIFYCPKCGYVITKNEKQAYSLFGIREDNKKP